MTEVCVHKAGVMQSMALHTARGYCHHFGGNIRADRLAGLIERFEDLYNTGHSPKQRHTRKKRGEANAALFVFPVYMSMDFAWRVLLTEGTHLAFEREKVFDLRDKRNRVTFDSERFELLQLMAKGAKPSWTWRMTQSVFNDYKTGVDLAIRHRSSDQDLKILIKTFYSLPGFRGVRSQVAGLFAHIHREWGRIKKDGPCPYVGHRPGGYLRYIPRHTVPLDAVVDRMMDGLTPFDPSWVYTGNPRRKAQAEARAVDSADDAALVEVASRDETAPQIISMKRLPQHR